MKEYLWNECVMNIDPFATREDVIEIKELNEWDVLIEFRDGRKIVFDRCTGYYNNLFYNNINELTEEQERKEFTYRLRSLMRRKGITQEELAERIGISRITISRYVRGETTPSVFIIRKIAKALGYSIDDFFYKNY